MSSSYYLSIDYHGDQIARFSDFLYLHSYREVNGIGFISFSLFPSITWPFPTSNI